MVFSSQFSVYMFTPEIQHQGYFFQAFMRNSADCNHIGCIEEAKCCRPTGAGRWGECTIADWSSSFDHSGPGGSKLPWIPWNWVLEKHIYANCREKHDYLFRWYVNVMCLGMVFFESWPLWECTFFMLFLLSFQDLFCHIISFSVIFKLSPNSSQASYHDVSAIVLTYMKPH